MLRFFEKRRERQADERRAVLIAECKAQFESASHKMPELLNEADATNVAALVQRASDAGLAEHETVRRLQLLERLWRAALDDEAAASVNSDALLAESARLQMSNTSIVRLLQRQTRIKMLRQRGPSVVAQDNKGRDVYFRGEAEYGNRAGSIDIRGDGLTFTGEVVVEIEWRAVTHAAKAMHSYRGYEQPALGLQEGNRRTLTKFVFLTADTDYACEVAIRFWSQARTAAATPDSA